MILFGFKSHCESLPGVGQFLPIDYESKGKRVYIEKTGNLIGSKCVTKLLRNPLVAINASPGIRGQIVLS